MGTNYYHVDDRNVCPTCGVGETHTHIGKSSLGWTFSFRGHEQIRSYSDWLEVLEAGGTILDEYGRAVSLDDFKALVASKVAGKNHIAEYPRDGWIDPEGHGFSGGDFS